MACFAGPGRQHTVGWFIDTGIVSMQQIQDNVSPPSFALFELGFRPFFSAAAVFAIVAIGLWMAMFVFSLPLAPRGLTGALWHGHEMVFGYAMAVIAGFLLTAVGNWTGVPGLRGTPLLGLLTAWAVARVAFFWPSESALAVAALADAVFTLGLLVAVVRPIVQVRQWKQLGILAKLVLLVVSNLVFYAGALGYSPDAALWGLYSGFYLVLALVLAMARRVVPFFIERGVEEPFEARNRAWLDVGSMGLFLVWAVLDVFFDQATIVGILSVVLFVLHTVRLRDWFTPGILRAPLLWSLYLGYGFLVLGFLLKALAAVSGIPGTLALHAFAFGGIGTITLGMMSRVSLGHTGRNVFDPPNVLAVMFSVLLVGALVRVIVPLIDGAGYIVWVGISQVLWMLGFGLFLIAYLPMLMQPRLDGRRG